MNILLMVVVVIAVLLVTVISHEWGHFIAARLFKMRVDEFGFGIPPRLWSWKKGETRYSINALPIGGFVRIAGENGVEDGSGAAPFNRQFDTKPWWQKSIVLVAGVICNIILAIILFTLSYMLGRPTITSSGVPTVISVVKNTPAEQAGIMVGDTVTSVEIGQRQVSILTTDSLRSAINASENDVSLTYVREGVSQTTTIVPKVDAGVRSIGLSVEPIANVPHSFFSALTNGVHETIYTIKAIFNFLGGLFVGAGAGGNVGGPVKLAQEIAGAASLGIITLIVLTASISVNLAVLNILPFPALDGGRLVVVLLEALFRRRFSPTVVGIIHTVGFIILLGLMAVLTVGDIRSLF